MAGEGPGNRYFAYGSNMEPDQMAFRGLEVERAEAARLPGYRLAFDFDARERWLGGAADIVPHEGSEVEGVLYHLGNDVSAMDPWEGAPEWYRRIQVEVEVQESGDSVEAWTYEVVDKLPYIPPSEGYIGKMILAARRFELSPGYVRSLRLHLARAISEVGAHVAVLGTLLDGGAWGTDELAARLGVRAELVDAVAGDLEGWGWVERTGEPPTYRIPEHRRDDVVRLLS
jgi:hypothetical protein